MLLESKGKEIISSQEIWDEAGKRICGGGSFIAVPKEWVAFQCQKQKEDFPGGIQAACPILTGKAIELSVKCTYTMCQ